MRFTGNDPGIRFAIVILLVLYALALGFCKPAEAAEGMTIGFGKGLAGSEACFDSLLLTQEVADRRWLAYLSTHGGSPSCRDDEEIRANVGAGLVRTADLGKWTLGFGAGVLEHGDVVVGPESILGNQAPRVAGRPQFHAVILIRRRLWRDRVVLDLLHKSTGDATYFNRGLNLIVLAKRF